MPRLIDKDHCPHCGAERGDTTSAFCADCGGSLQQRHLKAGCVSAAPVLVAAWFLWRCWAGA